MKTIFTEEELKYIIINYETKSTKEIAVKLDKTQKQVRSKACALGLSKGLKIKVFSEDEISYLKEKYNKVETKEIAEHLGRTVKQVSDKAYSLGLRREMKMRTYKEDFFEKIDTEEKAYWLGFLYADGCIFETYNKNTKNLKCRTLQLSLAKIDENHLKKYANTLGEDLHIYYGKAKLNNKVFEYCKVDVNNRKITGDLMELGCTPRKSLTLTFPDENIVPLELQKHFVRGYFDGDGCVHINQNNNSYIVNFVGTMNMIESIQEKVFHLGLNKTKIRPQGNANQVSWGGVNNLKRWYSYLYDDATIYLERKKEKFDKVCA